MPLFSVKEQFEEAFKTIFNNPKFVNLPFVEHNFLSIDKIEQNSILFIGLNPSRQDDLPLISGFYDVSQKGNEYETFFKKFEYIAEKTGQTWGHLDLLVLRETKQNNVVKLINEVNGIDFIYQQLQIAKKILEEVKPKIIVVANSLSRKFIGKMQSNGENIWLGYEFIFDNEIGTDRILNRNSNLKDVPVFFTSMLSGQRALDLGSLERLIWHINFVINRLEKTNN